jgi:putative ABC transport system substrate-binding protein
LAARGTGAAGRADAARHNVPAVYAISEAARDGGLLSYGVDYVDNFRRAATYVDRILHGEKPGDLPVQFPTKFEMVLNLKTAKALGPCDTPHRFCCAPTR